VKKRRGSSGRGIRFAAYDGKRRRFRRTCTISLDKRKRIVIHPPHIARRDESETGHDHLIGNFKGTVGVSENFGGVSKDVKWNKYIRNRAYGPQVTSVRRNGGSVGWAEAFRGNKCGEDIGQHNHGDEGARLTRVERNTILHPNKHSVEKRSDHTSARAQ